MRGREVWLHLALLLVLLTCAVWQGARSISHELRALTVAVRESCPASSAFSVVWGGLL
jgi:hypothetical protein